MRQIDVMTIDIPENQKVIRHLLEINPGREVGLLAPYQSTCDPYYALGSHPDIVERVWDDIGRQLSDKLRQICCGSPALVHPITGLIIAYSYGTAYALRFSPAVAARARSCGFKTTHKWMSGQYTNLILEVDPDWVFGEWSSLEVKWLHESFGPFEARA